MAIAKVQFKSSASATPEVWIDVTQKTVNEDNLLSGETALKNDGTNVVGTYVSLGGGVIFESMSANAISSWSKKTTVSVSNDTITFTPTTLDWGCAITANNLNFTYGQIKNGKVYIKFDYTISNAGDNTESLIVTSATWSTKNPDSESTRESWGDLIRIYADETGNASGTIDSVINVSDTFQSGTIPPNDNRYYGIRIYAHTGNGSTIAISNLSVGLLQDGGSYIPEAIEKQVNFIDYDGTILHSYTAQEANALTELPSNPSHTGLTAQGWNWTLAQIKAQLTADADMPIIVGQMYVTTSGANEIDITLDDSKALSLYLNIAVNGTVSVNWGDGSSAETMTGSSYTTSVSKLHTYAQIGDYTISINVTNGGMAFYSSSADNGGVLQVYTGTYPSQGKFFSNAITAIRIGNSTQIGNNAFHRTSTKYITIPSNITSIGTYSFAHIANVPAVIIPSGVTTIPDHGIHNNTFMKYASLPYDLTTIGSYAFGYSYGMKTIMIPKNVTTIDTYAYQGCVMIRHFKFPNSVSTISSYVLQNVYFSYEYILPSNITTINSYAFQNNYSLKKINIPNGVTTIAAYAFQNCHSLYEITIPATVTSIGDRAFQNCWATQKFHILATTPPSLYSSSVFNLFGNAKIYVPLSAVDTYKSASTWSSLASYIVGE